MRLLAKMTHEHLKESQAGDWEELKKNAGQKISVFLWHPRGVVLLDPDKIWLKGGGSLIWLTV